MKKILNVLSVLLLLGLLPSLTALGQEAVEVSPVTRPLQAADTPPEVLRRTRESVFRDVEIAKQQIEALEIRRLLHGQLRVLQNLQQAVQRVKTGDNPSALVPELTRELDNAIQIIQQLTEKPTVHPHNPPAITSSRHTANVPLNAEREKAYIELARQYFYVFATTPVEVPAVKDTASAGEKETSKETVPTKNKREEILDNFMACMKKISPAAQISLIQELIRSSLTNDELKLLEDLLDDVCVPQASN
jgi:hypothetical protein